MPVYFNAGSLEELYRRIRSVLESTDVRRWEITFVDDGSTDESAAVMERIRLGNDNVRTIRLSRNFGSSAAIQAGLAHAQGRAVAVIAADLQDPPEMLAPMVREWRSGAEVILATRESRDDPWTSRVLSACFYWLFRILVSSEMPRGGFDFFLLDRQAVRSLVDAPEKNVNMAASVLWLGFQRVVLPYRRGGRVHGRSMWTFWKKVKYMIDSLLSFSYVPLRVMAAVGVTGMVGALGYAGFIIVERLRGIIDQSGWASLMVVILFFNGTLLVSIGVVGEYVWRTLDAARPRPNYIVADVRVSNHPGDRSVAE